MAFDRTLRSGVAGQGIFDSAGTLVGHELLFRLPPAAHAPVMATESERELATVEVMNAVLDGDWTVADPPADGAGLLFVNVTRAFLVGRRPVDLDPQRVVIEVLESVSDDGEVVAGVTALQARGFQIAVDDWVGSGDRERLVTLAQYVKIDMSEVSEQRLVELVDGARERAPGAAVVVERIADLAGWGRARAAGADLFQGFFLDEPAHRTS